LDYWTAMRHRDKETVVEALEDWRNLRKKTTAEGGENYVKPVLVKFLDTGTFEVMDRDIVEDVFYVLREHKIMRDLAPDGRDLEAAIRDAGRETRPKGAPPKGSQRKPGHQGKPGQQGRPPRQGQPSQKGPASQQDQPSQKGPDEKRGPRRGRRRGRRTGKRGQRPPRDRGGPPPAA
jgi:hypothetical protein